MRKYHGQCVDLNGEVIRFIENWRENLYVASNIIIGSYPTENECIKQCLEWGGT